MASYLPSSIQKRLLRYALLRTGLLDTEELDLESLDIALGRQNAIELRNVGLNTRKLSSILELPAEFRLETARVLRLKLNVPADLYYGSITAEAHGVECGIACQATRNDKAQRARDTSSRGSPDHRKTPRRIGRSPPYHAGRDTDLPTTQDVARSFLMEEPEEEVHVLAQRYGSKMRNIKESVISDNSDEGRVGTGDAPGLPGFLAGFLQGIVDRFQFHIFDITASVSIPLENAQMTTASSSPRTVKAILKVETIDLGGVGSDDKIPTKRHLALRNIRLYLQGLQPVPGFPAQHEPRDAEGSIPDSAQPGRASPSDGRDLVESIYMPRNTPPILSPSIAPELSTQQLRQVIPTASDSPEPPDPFEIQAGEDNLTWTLRRHESSDAASDIWSDSDQPADLSASVTADRYLAGSPRVDQVVDRLASHGLEDHTCTAGSDLCQPSGNQGPAASSNILRKMEPLYVNSKSFASAPGRMSHRFFDRQTPASSAKPPEKDLDKDLCESRLDSEEEAESMFMSAYSTAPSQAGTLHSDAAEPRALELPGSISPADSTSTLSAPTDTADPMQESQFIQQNQGHHMQNPSSPRAITPTLSDAQAPAECTSQSSDIRADWSQMLCIDVVDIWIASSSGDDIETSEEGPVDSTRSRHISMSSSHAPHLPGAFSMYAEQSASVRFDDPNLRTANTGSQRSSGNNHIDIEVGAIQLAVDITMASEYLTIGKSVANLISVEKSSDATKFASHISEDSAQSMVFKFRSIDISLVKSATEYWRDSTNTVEMQSDTTPLAAIKVENAEISVPPSDNSADWCLRLGTLVITVGGSDLLYFSELLQESRVSSVASDADIYIEATTATAVASIQTVTQLSVRTKQVNFLLAFDVFEETFSTYGGLSSLLELSSSITNETTPRQPVAPARKGVRFQDSPEPSAVPSKEMKINARLAGVSAVVSSRIASVKLTSSAIKAVARSEYIAAAIDNVQLLGPQVDEDTSVKPLEVVLNGFRFEYLFHPKDADLERLLSLLTPTKNKYENDDDILIDTLLRQRRKGAVVRLTTAAIRARVSDWSFVDKLQAFADDLSSLSAVAKYLPEDERPGLLTLLRLQEAQVSIPVNQTFGDLKVSLQDVNVAQIGLPSLVAFSVGTFSAGNDGSIKLVHGFAPISPSEDLPMIMARMIGDEVEPTLRLKFFNLCVEYTVPAFLALTELGLDVKPEQILDLAASTVIELAAVTEHNLVSPSSLTSSSSKQGKKLSIDILFHDCMIGMQPDGLISKAVLVLNNAKISTEAPPKDAIKAAIELRKATVYVADEVQVLPKDSPIVKIALPDRLSLLFHDMGYVSVCSIMTARIDLQITESLDKSDKVVEVDVRNELFLLESCADSTHTLIKTLGALAPPMPPSKEQKFRSDAMTVDEMVASFTGGAFEPSAGPSSTIFDVDTTDPAVDDGDLIDASMTESFYGGVAALDDPEEDFMVQDDVGGGTAESLLEEDPFEIPDDPKSARLNNRDLTKALNEQLTCNLEGGPVELKPFLLSDDQLDRLPGESTVLGAPHRWNTPRSQKPTLVDVHSRKPLPFRLRVREVHLIWNLYDGYDWQGTRHAISQAVEEVEIRAEERRMRRKTAIEPDDEESIIGDCLFNSIYIGVPANKDPNELRRMINRGIDDLASESESYATSGISKPTNLSSGSGQRTLRRPRKLKLERSQAHKIAFEAKGVSADILVFPPGGEAQSSVDVRIRDFEIFDNLPTSTWRKFMTPWHKDTADREMAKPFIHAEINTIRTVPTLSATELVLTVSITPIRLHVDQDALDFMTRFFEFKPASASPTVPSDEPFLQRIEIHTVELLLDYKPKRVDYAGLRSGRYTEFKNFFILDAAHISLKHAILYGIKGFDPLHDTLNDIWMPDIKANQLPGIISGLASVAPLVNLGQGFAEVIAVPIREYRKDGRVVRSIQKGAVHLMRNTTSEIARFGARVAVGTQNVLVGAETMLSPAQGTRDGRTDVEDEQREERAVSAYANQPLGVLAGLKSARRHLERDLLMARDAVIAVQGEVLDAGSASAAAQAVVRHAPTILLRPVIGASKVVGQTLMGAGNQLDRGYVKKLEDKYKQR